MTTKQIDVLDFYKMVEASKLTTTYAMKVYTTNAGPAPQKQMVNIFLKSIKSTMNSFLDVEDPDAVVQITGTACTTMDLAWRRFCMYIDDDDYSEDYFEHYIKTGYPEIWTVWDIFNKQLAFLPRNLQLGKSAWMDDLGEPEVYSRINQILQQNANRDKMTMSAFKGTENVRWGHKWVKGEELSTIYLPWLNRIVNVTEVGEIDVRVEGGELIRYERTDTFGVYFYASITDEAQEEMKAKYAIGPKTGKESVE